MIRYLPVWLWVMLSCTDLQAQQTCNISINIVVTEAHTSEPMPGVLLYFSEQKQQAQTDETGKVVLDGVCPGLLSIHFHSDETKDTVVSLSVYNSSTYRIALHHSEQVLHQVVVRNRHVPLLIQDKAQVSADELHRQGGKNLAELLKNINGVNTLSNGATISKPVIHGLHSNRILMLNNGIRQEDQQWGAEHAPNIDPFVAEQITVLKGAAGVRYGTDAVGGVVLVEPAPVRTETGWGGSLNLAAYSNNRMGSASGMIEHRLVRHPEFSFRLQGTLKQAGNYRIPGGLYVANTGVQEQNFSGTLNYRGVHSGTELFLSRFHNTLGIYSGSHTGSQQDLENAIRSPVPLVPAPFTYTIGRPKQVVTHDLVKLKAYRDNRLGMWSLVYAFQHNFRQEYDIMRVDNGKAQLNLSLNTQSVNLNLDHKKIGNIEGQAGIDFVYQHNTFRDGDRVFIPSYYSYGTACYLIERYRKNSWTAEAGLRYDYKHFDMYNPEGVQLQNVHYRFDYRNPSATLAMRKQVTKQWECSATLANAWRAPQAAELFSAGLHQAGARIEIGNRNLNPEKAYSLTLASQYEVKERLKLEVSLYTQAIQDFIYLHPGKDVLTIRGYYKTFNYVQTNALLSGADISLHYHWSKYFSTEAKVSLLRARDRSQKDWLILMPSDRLAAGARYTFNAGKGLQDGFFSVNGNYVLQQTRIPANFDQVDYPRPPAAYFLLNAEAGGTIRCRKQPLQLSISAQNILNTKYRDYMDVFRYFIDQQGTNIALHLHVPFH